MQHSGIPRLSASRGRPSVVGCTGGEERTGVSIKTAPEVKLLTARQVAVQMGISESQVWHLVRSKELDSLKIGWSRRIPADAIGRYIKKRLDAEQAS